MKFGSFMKGIYEPPELAGERRFIGSEEILEA